MRFSAIPILIPLVALVSDTYAFVMLQTCNGANDGSPCVNWGAAFPPGRACFNLATRGQDKIVSSMTVTFDVVCTLYVDAGCTGSSVTVKKTFLNLADVGFDNVVSSIGCATGSVFAT
ncbi:hypothetical protein DFH09DRAFT_1132129 [Mycena vulgaris]|nr:hypothetical protein DFH09DRAFT_1132129 [Mycena vulgaris]